MTHRIFVFALTGALAFAGLGSAQEKPAKLGSGASPAQLPQDPKEALAAARWLEKAYSRSQQPESVRMLIAIANGSHGAGEGWFGPCQTAHTWGWLARHHAAKQGSISAKDFCGPADLFARLDRNRDGRISADDLDWSERGGYLQQAALVNRLFAPINARRDGKITRDEMLAFFDKASGGKGHMTLEDLHAVLFPSTPRAFMPGDGPTQEVLVRGLFAGGELGSLQEGPALGQTAPDFTLKTADGKQTVRFSSLQGPRPIVLVLGNLTCGPFRRTAAAVEALHQRYKDRVTFVGVYVREAHPTDGWAMESNKRAGFAVKQPRTYEERAKVCTQFCEAIRPTMPFLVDEINDPVGNAYSGMPGRLYVIDPKGKVAYKSGRGPFGFKVGELEQALVMSLLEFPPAAKKVAEKPVDPSGVKKP